MKNIIIAIGLAVLLGVGFYFYKEYSHHEGEVHSHDSGQSHSH